MRVQSGDAIVLVICAIDGSTKRLTRTRSDLGCFKRQWQSALRLDCTCTCTCTCTGRSRRAWRSSTSHAAHAHLSRPLRLAVAQPSLVNLPVLASMLYECHALALRDRRVKAAAYRALDRVSLADGAGRSQGLAGEAAAENGAAVARSANAVKVDFVEIHPESDLAAVLRMRPTMKQNKAAVEAEAHAPTVEVEAEAEQDQPEELVSHLLFASVVVDSKAELAELTEAVTVAKAVARQMQAMPPCLDRCRA